MNPRVYCAPSRIHGYGIFTRDFIRAWQTFGISLGFFMDINAQGHGGINDLINGNIISIDPPAPKDMLYHPERYPAKTEEQARKDSLHYKALQNIHPNEELTLRSSRAWISKYQNPVYQL